jgi:hypothetical protein
MPYLTLTLTQADQTFDLPIVLNHSSICLISVYNYRSSDITLLTSDCVESEIVNNELLPVVAILPIVQNRNCARRFIRPTSHLRLSLRHINRGEVTLPHPVVLHFKLE